MARLQRLLKGCVLLAVAGMVVPSRATAAGPQTGIAIPCAPAHRIDYAPWVFLGYACPAHCREHKAGFAWAERQGIGNPAACATQVGAVREGCRAYAEYAVTAELAGFEWARENEVADACECRGAGPAFQAGCEAYLETAGE
jgi:hypothetical protein